MQIKDENLVRPFSLVIERIKKNIFSLKARIEKLKGEIEKLREICDKMDNAQILLGLVFEIIGKYNNPNFILSKVKRIGEVREKIQAGNPLNFEDEKFLGNLIQNGDNEARELLILGNLNLAKYVATSLRKKIVMPFEDITQIAFLGLIDAVDKYDPAKNLRFKTYAEWRIRGAILDAVRSDYGVVRITRRLLKNIKKISDIAVESFEAGRHIEVEEIIAKTDQKERQILEILTLLQDDFTFSSANFVSNDEIFFKFLRDNSLNPEQIILLKEKFTQNIIVIDRMLKHLSTRQNQVIRTLYGIGDSYLELSQAEVAIMLRLAESTISSCCNKGFKKIAEIFNVNKEAVRDIFKETCLIYQILGGV